MAATVVLFGFLACLKACPIYKAEIPLIEAVGIERFFDDLDIDFFDVQRKRVAISAIE